MLQYALCYIFTCWALRCRCARHISYIVPSTCGAPRTELPLATVLPATHNAGSVCMCYLEMNARVIRVCQFARLHVELIWISEFYRGKLFPFPLPY
jgi:hypothetical protein